VKTRSFLFLLLFPCFAFGARQVPKPYESIPCAPLVLRDEPKSVTVTMIIPCAAKHVSKLKKVLDACAAQTCIPEEVVIAVSDVVKATKAPLDEIEKLTYPFKLKIIRNQQRLSPGDNRNIASKQASGTLWMYQNANDLPHPQRVELVKALVENYKIDHVLHLRGKIDGEPKKYGESDIEITRYTRFPQGLPDLNSAAFSMDREIFRKMTWDSGFGSDKEDEYIKRVYVMHRSAAVINLPLTITLAPEPPPTPAAPKKR
jgi:hypothetical protein